MVVFCCHTTSAKSAAGVEVYGALVVLDHTGYGNGIANLQIGRTFALQAEALDRLLGVIAHLNGYGDAVPPSPQGEGLS